MTQSDLPRCLLITHANLGEGLLAAANQILGPLTEVSIVSNSDLALPQLLTVVEEHCSPGTDTFLFSDFKGGSCDLAARKVAAAAPGRYSVSGVNLAMLLSFFTKREKLKGGELQQTVADAGQRGIQI